MKRLNKTVKLSNSQLTKSKSGIKNGTEATLKISSDIVSGSSNKNTKIYIQVS